MEYRKFEEKLLLARNFYIKNQYKLYFLLSGMALANLLLFNTTCRMCNEWVKTTEKDVENLKKKIKIEEGKV